MDPLSQAASCAILSKKNKLRATQGCDRNDCSCILKQSEHIHEMRKNWKRQACHSFVAWQHADIPFDIVCHKCNTNWNEPFVSPFTVHCDTTQLGHWRSQTNRNILCPLSISDAITANASTGHSVRTIHIVPTSRVWKARAMIQWTNNQFLILEARIYPPEYCGNMCLPCLVMLHDNVCGHRNEHAMTVNRSQTFNFIT